MEKRGNTKLIFVILAIVIVIAILLYVIFNGFKSNQSSDNLYKELLGCDKLDEQSLLNKCINNWEPEICRYAGKDGLIGFCKRIVTRQSKNTNICGFYNNTNEKNFCYNDVAIGSANQDICNKIQGVNETWDGKPINRKVENCYSSVAEFALSEEMCLTISADFIRDECYGEIAKAKNDKSICNLIKDSRSKELCLG